MEYPQVWQIGLELGDMFDDFFMPIARDGAAMLEIHIRLQKSFIMLASISTDLRLHAQRHSSAALARAEQAMVYIDDIKQLKQLHRQLLDSV